MSGVRLIRRILRVNHAYPDLIPWLQETLGHEQRHRRLFHEAMPSRAAKSCRMMFVWSFGGCALGALTAVCGRTGIYVCTGAVERTVHRHMVEQIVFLDRTDPPLAQIVRDILAEEDVHLAHAEAHHNKRALFARMLSALVSAATETLIFAGTRGDSLNLKRQMATS